ncbi:hypothetical protein, conserved [Eimeria praecox]|uniref:Microneme protein 13, related n=1 Tax=Eimeria praecox TaxID=51316 RepID=U6GZD1_9EIME|nr:hypothetical protein, conserved [Eimeria praecox]
MKMRPLSIYLVAPALLALGASDGVFVKGDDAPTAGDEVLQVPEAPSILQKVMDASCQQAFARACLVNPHFCVSALARRDVGNKAADGEAWRCYSTVELDFTLTKESCVDDCGELIECKGAIKEYSLEHLSATQELEQLLLEVKEGMCKIHVRYTLDITSRNIDRTTELTYTSVVSLCKPTLGRSFYDPFCVQQINNGI